jgi:hypothetical protein
MLLLLLTAREGRVSANHLGCPSSRSSRRAHVHPRPAPPHSCVSRSRPEAFLTTKPAILRVFYIGTNSHYGALARVRRAGAKARQVNFVPARFKPCP